MSDYTILQSAIYLGKRTTGGAPTGLKFIGDASEAKYSLAVEKKEKKENWSGLMSTAASTITGRTAKLSLVADELTLENMKRGVHGADASQTTGTVAAQAIATAAVGDLIPLSKQNVSSVVITDSTAVTPVTLVEGTHYRLKPKHGSIELLTTEGITFPLSAAFSYGATKTVGIAAEAQTEWYCRIEGLNLVDNSAIVAEFYKLQIDPAAEISFVGGDYGSYKMECSVLIDATKAADSDLGQFGFISVI